MKVSRAWATPLAAGALLLMAVTGGSMFFHLNTPQGKTLHEWLGWALVLGVVLHVSTSWTAFKGHLGQTKGRVVIGLFAAMLAIGLVPVKKQPSYFDLSYGTVTTMSRTPIRQLSPIAGRDVDAIVADLQRAGFRTASADATMETVAGTNKGDRLRALAIVFPKPDEKR